MQPKGWLDSTTYQKWDREVVLPYLNGREGYLLQDAFSIHAKDENVTVLQHAGVEVEFIPAGYTAVLEGIFSAVRTLIAPLALGGRSTTHHHDHDRKLTSVYVQTLHCLSM